MPTRRKPPLPSRQKVAYAAIPREYAELLDALTAAGARHEGRSRATLVRLAVRAFLQAEGLLDDKGRPKGKAEGG